VPREDLVNYFLSDPKNLKKAFDYFLGRYLNYHMRINALEQSKAGDKVLNMLHFLCLRYGKDVKQDVVRIQIPLTQQDLANFMGLTRETTGIELKKLEKAGILTYGRQNYIVHTDKLDDLLDDDYSAGRLKEEESFFMADPQLARKLY
jgi:CRP/FNR family transcriptional regulator